MSCLVSKRFRHLLLIFGSVVASNLAADPVRAGESGQPASPAASQDGVTSTNVNQLKTKQLREELFQQQLQKDVIRSLNLFGSKGSLRGVAPPPIRPPAAPLARNKQIKQLLEREKNWAFMTPDDLKEEQTLEEIFKLRRYDDGRQPREELSFLGRYYESLDRDRFGGTNRSGGHFDARRDELFSAQDHARNWRYARSDHSVRNTRHQTIPDSTTVFLICQGGQMRQNLRGKKRRFQKSEDRKPVSQMGFQQYHHFSPAIFGTDWKILSPFRIQIWPAESQGADCTPVCHIGVCHA